MSNNHKVEALTVVVRQFLTDGMDTEEACNTLGLVGFKTIIGEIRENWLYFAELNNVKLKEQDFTDEEFEQVISSVSSSLENKKDK